MLGAEGNAGCGLPRRVSEEDIVLEGVHSLTRMPWWGVPMRGLYTITRQPRETRLVHLGQNTLAVGPRTAVPVRCHATAAAGSC